jgi:SAM-dependent methyltransferase
MDLSAYSRSAEVYDVVYSGMLDYPDLALQAHAVIQGRKPGATTLLEVACGTGLYLVEMARWYDVVGLDYSADMLEVAAARLPEVSLHEADMADFDLGRTFDAVICMFSSIGYVVTVDRMRSAIQCFARHLAPGGVLIVEPWLPPGVFIDGHTSSEAFEKDGVGVARAVSSTLEGNVGTMRWAFAVARPGGDLETYTEEHKTGLFTIEEQEQALDDAGLISEYDPAGLIGRGLFVGVKPVVV